MQRAIKLLDERPQVICNASLTDSCNIAHKPVGGVHRSVKTVSDGGWGEIQDEESPEKRDSTFGDGAPRPLLQLAPADHVAVQDTARGVRKPHLSLATALLLEVPANASKRAARPGRSDERVDPPARLRPNLGPGGAVVRVRVGRVVELVRPDRAGRVARKVARLVVVVLRIFVRDRGDGAHVRAEHSEQVDLLLALRVRHVDHAAVPFGAADVRQADARVARGPFDDRAARLEPVQDGKKENGVTESVTFFFSSPFLRFNVL